MKKVIFIMLLLMSFVLGCSSLPSKEATKVQYVSQGTFNEPQPIMLPKKPVFKKSTPAGQMILMEKFEPEKKSLNTGAAIRRAQENAKETATDDRFVNAITEYEFQDGKIYEIYIARQRITNIRFQEGEKFALEDIQIGESSGMHRPIIRTSGSGTKERINLQLRPKKSGVHTNMVITTNKRTYYMTIKSFNNTYQTAVYWTYPQEEFQKQVTKVYEEAQKKQNPGFTLDMETANLNYDIIGDAAWKPLRVLDNGKQTCIIFPESTKHKSLPPFFLAGENNEAQITNYHYDEKIHSYIVHRLFDAGILKLGKGKKNQVLIYNKKAGSNNILQSKRYQHAR